MTSTSNKQNIRLRIRQNASPKEKTLIRLVAETLKKLVCYYQVKSCEDIFLNFEVQILRYKLKECLNKLMFLEPLEFGQKAEDTIWKSIFYEPIRLFKRRVKSDPAFCDNKSLICIGFRRHILASVGYYQKLILRLITEFNLIKELCPDFIEYFPTYELDSIDSESFNDKQNPEIKKWAVKCIERSLLYIGDLYRYEQDIKETKTVNLALRYYHLVLRLNPSCGHAYNQLATMDTCHLYGLTATFYYLKAQLCTQPFSQSRDNLLILFDRNVKRLRAVIDKELMLRKSGSSSIRKSNVKVMRVKSCIIKYINIWYSFLMSHNITEDELHQLANMCDDALSHFSCVLGYDRKLISDSNSNSSTNRPTSLNSALVARIIFIGYGLLVLMRTKDEESEVKDNQSKFDAADDCDNEDDDDDDDDDEDNDDDDDEKEKENYKEKRKLIFNLAHAFVLNLFGHVLNQCLVRLRDELRSLELDVGLVFRRHDSARNVEHVDEVEVSTDNIANISNDSITSSKRKKKLGLSQRLVRPLHGTSDIEDDNSESEVLSENNNDIWDDYSDSSELESDKSSATGPIQNRKGGFNFSDDEDDNFLGFSDEEIHSQDEDDQIIRAIVGQNTVFGRKQNAALEKDAKKMNKNKEGTCLADKDLYDKSKLIGEPLVKKGKLKDKLIPKLSGTNQLPKKSEYPPNLPKVLANCIYNVDLFQSVSGVIKNWFQYLKHENNRDLADSFYCIWRSAPYLWKHLAVTLNFCENILDDLDKCQNLGKESCNHVVVGNVRSTPLVTSFTEECESGDDIWSITSNTQKIDTVDDANLLDCSDPLHTVISRLQQIIIAGSMLVSLAGETGNVSPLILQRTVDGNYWKHSTTPLDNSTVKGNKNSVSRYQLISCCLSELSGTNETIVASTSCQEMSHLEDSVSNAVDREKVMREMARLRLENEFSANGQSQSPPSKSLSISSDNENNEDCLNSEADDNIESNTNNGKDEIRSVYLVPDAEYLCKSMASGSLMNLLKTRRYIVVVPQVVLRALDRRKGNNRYARKVIKLLEDEVRNNNKHLKLESVNEVKPAAMNCQQIEDWSAIESSVTQLVEKASLKAPCASDSVVTVLIPNVYQLEEAFVKYYMDRKVNFKSILDIW